MPKMTEYLSIGICNSYGDGDYRLSMAVTELTFEQMQRLRAIIPVAIAQLEQAWMAEHSKRQQACAQQGIAGDPRE